MKFMVCKIFVAHYPQSLNMGKGMAQAHHAGFQMAMKYHDHPDVINYMNFTDDNGVFADKFGPTIVLESLKKNDVVTQIRNVVDLAKRFNLVSDIVVDPTYPVADGFLVEAVTCGYVLAEHDHVFWSLVGNGWTLHR